MEKTSFLRNTNCKMKKKKIMKSTKKSCEKFILCFFLKNICMK